MSTPRQPYGPDDRERAEWDPYRRDADDENGSAAWGRPPAGGWGTTGGTGHDDEYRGRSEQGSRYGSGAHRDDRGRGRTRDDRARDDRYGEPGQERYEPSWGQGPPLAPRRSARRSRRPRWVVLGAAGVVVVAFLVLGFVAPGWFVTRVLDASAVQTGVAKILTDDYGVDGVVDVHCPGGVAVTAGVTFTCDAAIDGDPVKVPVRVLDAKGGYEVGRPT